MALAGDVIENIAFRLLLISDDYGRFPNDPEGLKVMMNDTRHSVKQIRETIGYLNRPSPVEPTVERYEVDGQAICHWVRWDDYQNIRWTDDAKYPGRDGLYEVSNNPQTIAKRTDKRNAKRVVRQDVKRVDKRIGQQSESESESEEEIKHEKKPSANADGCNKFVALWIDLCKEIRQVDFKPTKQDIGQIRNMFKHVKGDLTEFEKAVRCYLSSEYVKVPTPGKLYVNFEPYRSGGAKDIPWRDEGGL
jgi:hypothetical protein